ncbi:MAG: CehA/McbA family metallohydrolase [Limnochordia bacterium]|jgi:hypothetical protein|nr:CehA/McbA family metallohydrolase [Limnochordia bacterium]
MKDYFEHPDWFRGNIHCHSTRSDGAKEPEEVFAWYQQEGYDFIALTDHERFYPGGQYENMLIIPGIEEAYHIVGLGMESFPAKIDRSSRQEVIDAIIAWGGVAILAHPYWLGLTDQDISVCTKVTALEVYNAVCDFTIARGYSGVHWDNQLGQSNYLNGVAVDDAHWHHAGEGGGFVMVNAPKLTVQCILDALKLGSYFSTQGPLFKQITLSEEGEVLASFSRVMRVDIISNSSSGQVIQSEAGIEQVTYKMGPHQRYIRLQITDFTGKMAWSNPILPF